MAQTYKVVRHFARGGRRVIKRDLSLAEAQAHCQDSETSSDTCQTAARRRYTENKGPWFDGYYPETEMNR